MDVIGVFFDGPTQKVARLRKQRGKVKIIGLDVKPLYIPGACYVGTVPSVVRSLDFPVSSFQKVKQGLPFQVESLSHAPMEEMVYTTTLSRHEKGIQAQVFFTRKETIQAHLSQWRSHAIEPDFVCPESAALIAFARFRWPDLVDGILVYRSMCIWMEQGKVKKTFTVIEGEKQTRLQEVIASFQETGGVKMVLRLDQEEPHALPIGAALHRLEKEPLQFLTGPLTPRKAFRTAGKKLCTFVGIAACAALGLLGLDLIKTQQHETFTEQEALEKAAATLQKYPTELPYVLQVPSVTEVLSWVSRHPLSKTFHLTDIRYRLTSLPTIETPSTTYQAVIDLELQIESPTLARKFHDALLQEKTLIDQAKEISWTARENLYRTSFHLKQRPPHVF